MDPCQLAWIHATNCIGPCKKSTGYAEVHGTMPRTNMSLSWGAHRNSMAYASSQDHAISHRLWLPGFWDEECSISSVPRYHFGTNGNARGTRVLLRPVYCVLRAAGLRAVLRDACALPAAGQRVVVLRAPVAVRA